MENREVAQVVVRTLRPTAIPKPTPLVASCCARLDSGAALPQEHGFGPCSGRQRSADPSGRQGEFARGFPLRNEVKTADLPNCLYQRVPSVPLSEEHTRTAAGSLDGPTRATLVTAPLLRGTTWRAES